MRTAPCTPDMRRGRMRKAEQFTEAAAAISDLAEDAPMSPTRT